MIEPTKKTTVKPVAAVERALVVLEAFKSHPTALTFTEVVAATGLLKTTVFRILHTLQEAEYIVRLPDGSFQLGAVFMQFSMVYQRSLRLQDHIPPVLKRLVELTEESASFYVREGEQRVCLYRVESQQMVRDVVPAGTVLPIDDTAASIVLRSYDKLSDIPTLLANDYDSMIHTTVGKGTTPQVASISAPVLNYEGLLGAISLTGPKERFTPDELLRMRQILCAEAWQLSKRLCGTTVVDHATEVED